MAVKVGIYNGGVLSSLGDCWLLNNIKTLLRIFNVATLMFETFLHFSLEN